jgi:hypothetical protein
LAARLEEAQRQVEDLSDRLEESDRLQSEAVMQAEAANHRADELERQLGVERRRTDSANRLRQQTMVHIDQAREAQKRLAEKVAQMQPDPDQTVPLFTIDVHPEPVIPPMPSYKPTVGAAEVADWAVDAGLVRRSRTKTITPDGDTVEMDLPDFGVRVNADPTSLPGQSVAVTWATPTSSEDPQSSIQVVTAIVPVAD